MSKLNIFLLIILAFMLIFARSDDASVLDQKETVIPTVTSTPTPTPRMGKPLQFSIQKITVDAPVDPVGVDETGKMLLPLQVDRVGWYEHGARPGEVGNAVMAGHLDSATGEGGIFYNLWMLQPGDEMNILNENGEILTFIVTENNTYEFDKVPIDYYFGKSDKKRLNLITCTGTWNFATQNYSHRMIVSAELKE